MDVTTLVTSTSVPNMVSVRKGLINGQAMVDFKNGYSASVVCNEFSYGGKRGLFEIAVFHNGDIDYTTPITDDVVGYLTEQGVLDILDAIGALDAKD